MTSPINPPSQRLGRTVDELYEHNSIVVGTDKPFPQELHGRVEQMLNAPVMPEHAPGAQHIVEQHHKARLMDKKSAVDIMEPLLLFQRERPGHVRGIPNIDVSHDYILTADMFPPSSNADTLKFSPDVAIGYLRSRDTETRVDSEFTERDHELQEK